MYFSFVYSMSTKIVFTQQMSIQWFSDKDVLLERSLKVEISMF